MGSIILIVISVIVILVIVAISVYNTYFHKQDVNSLLDYGIKYNLYKNKKDKNSKVKIEVTNKMNKPKLTENAEGYYLEEDLQNGVSIPFYEGYKISSPEIAHNPQCIDNYKIVWEEFDSDGLYSFKKFFLSVVPLMIFAILILLMNSIYSSNIKKLKATAENNFNSIQSVSYDLSQEAQTFDDTADLNLLFLTDDSGNVEDALLLYNMNDSLTITELYLNTPVSYDETLQDIVNTSKQDFIDFINEQYCLKVVSVTEMPKSVIYSTIDTMNGLVYDLHVDYIQEYINYCKASQEDGYSDSIVELYNSLLRTNDTLDGLSFEQFTLDTDTARVYAEWNRISSDGIAHDNWDLTLCYMFESLKNCYKNQGYSLIFTDNSSTYQNIKTTIPIDTLKELYTKMSYSIVKVVDDDELNHEDYSFTVRNLNYNLTVSDTTNPYTEDYMSGFGYFPVDKARTCLYYCLKQ
jgi:hypothetical protein